MYSNCKWWFQNAILKTNVWTLKLESSWKIKVLLKYICSFGHEKNECMCSDVYRTSTLKLLGTSAYWLRTEPAGSGSNEMFSWWVGDCWTGYNLGFIIRIIIGINIGNISSDIISVLFWFGNIFHWIQISIISGLNYISAVIFYL